MSARIVCSGMEQLRDTALPGRFPRRRDVRAHNLNSLCARLSSSCRWTASSHGGTKYAFKLLRDVFRNGLCVYVHALNFDDVYSNRNACKLRGLSSSSTPVPPLPITIPGLPVKILTEIFCAARSISIFEMPAAYSFSLKIF